jgi:putative two-component system hydrogenase maturation factor HypX/HoxX
MRYEERNRVGYLHFEFYNGAMSTQQWCALPRPTGRARRRSTLAIVLMGESDLWFNGIHLNVIETSEDPEGVLGEHQRDG